MDEYNYAIYTWTTNTSILRVGAVESGGGMSAVDQNILVSSAANI